MIGEVTLDVKVSPREVDCVHGYFSPSHTQRFSGFFRPDGSTEETDGPKVRLISTTARNPSFYNYYKMFNLFFL